jgi:hypothetical protein
MKRVNCATASYLIDFSGGKKELEALAEQQLEGCVALHNMLVDGDVAYLADEVGMGKTYIALGVVALMRRFNPALRVLYLLPKNNVRDKWHKDYLSFIEYNYRRKDLAVKGLNNTPVAPHAVCSRLQELIHAVATASERDYFICTSAFSFALGNTQEDLRNSLDQFTHLFPQHQHQIADLKQQTLKFVDAAKLLELKASVKHKWAAALNAILPRFDLVVVDEAHNLKKGRSSSDRNELLATILGADDPDKSRLKRLLLLSATPYDRQLDHLRNQLDLFGFAQKANLPEGSDSDLETARTSLSRLMVRRLNEIELDAKMHTRNMYRTEHRSGDQAEVRLNPEQQLFAALLQKKVSEHLEENCAGRFELGMLASFESYLPSDKNKVIEFDGQDDKNATNDLRRKDARDRYVVESLVDDYLKTFGVTPPHPKMDAVAEQNQKQAFLEGKKQLIFVRRVRSVAELKFKQERLYDSWLGQYLQNDAPVYFWFQHYMKQQRQIDTPLEEATPNGDDVAAKGDNFFTWFYRGVNPELEAGHADGVLGILPVNFRKRLGQTSFIFESNWVQLQGMPDARTVTINWKKLIPRTERKATPQLRYRHAQYAYLRSVAFSNTGQLCGIAAERILSATFSDFKPGLDLADTDSLAQDLQQKTLWECFRNHEDEKLRHLSPQWDEEAFSIISGNDERAAERHLRRNLIFQELIGVDCRLDHTFIDLYSLRTLHKASEEAYADSSLIHAFVELLGKQAQQGGTLSSFKVLSDIAQNLDLLVKLNFPNAYHVPAGSLTTYLTKQINPLAPIIGASGETGDKSPPARKFRMPGYPRILISTDVFQEGEDLHTFCDSVVHYGISASPIALEQKVGRVDRVASLAYRAMSENPTNFRKHFIQVGFPHIKQSLEFFQVCQAALNLNNFLRSLHKLKSSNEFSDQVIIRDNLSTPEAIEPLITNRLESPFNIREENLAGIDLTHELKEGQSVLEKRLIHVRHEVENYLGTQFPAAIGSTTHSKITERWLVHQYGNGLTMEFSIRNSKGFPELLFAASALDESTFPSELIAATERIDYLRLQQDDFLVRVQLLDDKDEGYILKRNAEVYAGGEGVLVINEIQDACRRTTKPQSEVPVEFSANDFQSIHAKINALSVSNGPITVAQTGNDQITYSFSHEGRQQKVSWRLSGNYLLITSRVLDSKETLNFAAHGKNFAESPIINSTLRRNALFDLVDFHIGSSGDLSVRACHPIAHLNQVELAFLAHLVAAEADRLEQIICNADYN